ERILDSSEFIFKNLQQLTSHASQWANTRFAPTSHALKVTYHDPCHLSRYQGITMEPREIIKSIPGIEFIELPEADWCCGGAGSYSIENNEISMKILERKINNVKKTGADILATSCPACMIQLSYGVKRFGLNVKVVHVNQLIRLSLKATEVPAME
ncbi:MAG: (Fe-S)-binding protein, partial [Deltaproteobacteria bacterium]